MVWLVINQVSSLQPSMEAGLAALTQALDHRRNLGCTITPNDPPTFGVQYHVQHPNNGFEYIYLSDEEPEQVP